MMNLQVFYPLITHINLLNMSTVTMVLMVVCCLAEEIYLGGNAPLSFVCHASAYINTGCLGQNVEQSIHFMHSN